MAYLLHEIVTEAAWRTPAALALRGPDRSLNYTELEQCVQASAQALLGLGLQRGERVAILLEQCEEAVLAMFGAAAAGGAFVPINPALKPEQVAHILRDSGACILLVAPGQRALLDPVLGRCPALRCVVQTGGQGEDGHARPVLAWDACLREARSCEAHRVIETDLAAILYTAGGPAYPKGMALSHRNLLAGADSLVRCLGMQAQDRILAVLPFCREDGFSQMSAAFASSAAVVLTRTRDPRELADVVARERITGLAAEGPLWTWLAEFDWQELHALRYLASCAGLLPPEAVASMRRRLPRTRLFFMHSMGEVVRSTVLAPEEIEARPGSIGKAMPNAELLVLDADGWACAPGQPGELVQRGPLVGQGYWNDSVGTAAAFRPLLGALGMPLSETVLWSGETVCADADGYLYPVARTGGLASIAGPGLDPDQIEAIVYGTGLVAEVAAVAIAHPVHGQAIALVASAAPGSALDSAQLLAACLRQLPRHLIPCMVDIRAPSLPRGDDGQIDRGLLAEQLGELFAEALA